MVKLDTLHLFNHQEKPLRVWFEPYGMEYWIESQETMDVPIHGDGKIVELSVEEGTLVICEGRGTTFDFDNIVRKCGVV